MLKKIISGGQTGVDRAALNVAMKMGISHGGWAPKGRTAEDGKIPTRYNLQETDSADPSVRTIKNIHEADATLILVQEIPIKVTDGTILTIEESKKKKPSCFLIIDLSKTSSVETVVNWLEKSKPEIKTLNIAGPKESQSHGIQTLSEKFLEEVMIFLLNKKNNCAVELHENEMAHVSGIRAKL